MTTALSVTLIVFTLLICQLNESLLSLRSEIESGALAINTTNKEYLKKSNTLPYLTDKNNTTNLISSTAFNTFEASAQQADEGENSQPTSSLLQNSTLASSLLNNALVPDAFSMLSVIIRTTIIASLVFLIVKWLGGKGIGQLSPFGLLIVVGLGSAIGDPMIYKEISIPQAMAAVIIAVVFFKAIDYLTLKSKRFRNSVEPKPITLVEYGSIDDKGLKKAKMDFGEFEVQMRLNGIENVDEIKFARLEPNGQVSFIIKKTSNPSSY